MVNGHTSISSSALLGGAGAAAVPGGVDERERRAPTPPLNDDACWKAPAAIDRRPTRGRAVRRRRLLVLAMLDSRLMLRLGCGHSRRLGRPVGFLVRLPVFGGMKRGGVAN